MIKRYIFDSASVKTANILTIINTKLEYYPFFMGPLFHWIRWPIYYQYTYFLFF